MESTKYTDLIGRYFSGEITAAEKGELMAWVEADSANKAFFEEMARLWSVSSEYEEEPYSTDIKTAWASFERKFEQRFRPAGGSPLAAGNTETAKVFRLRPLRMALRYAAAIALLLAAGYWFLMRDGNDSTQIASFRTSAGEKRELMLPDGSTVILNENSELAYATSFEKRRVRLSGEAFFEVARLNGQTFTIDAEGATTTVLGTSFNVRAYPSEGTVEVSVQTGKVALQKSEDKEAQIILEAGEAGVFDKEKDAIQPADISNADSWKTQRLYFDNTPLGVVVGALERYFGVDIEVANPKLLNCRFVGEFSQPELKEILDVLAFTMLLDAEKQKDGSYVLKGESAQCE